MHTFQSRYTYGDKVYLKTDRDQLQRLVIEIQFSPGQVLYHVSCSTETSTHYEFELSDAKDEALVLGLSKETL
jgi:hypothetical protein